MIKINKYINILCEFLKSNLAKNLYLINKQNSQVQHLFFGLF